MGNAKTSTRQNANTSKRGSAATKRRVAARPRRDGSAAILHSAIGALGQLKAPASLLNQLRGYRDQLAQPKNPPKGKTSSSLRRRAGTPGAGGD